MRANTAQRADFRMARSPSRVTLLLLVSVSILGCGNPLAEESARDMDNIVRAQLLEFQDAIEAYIADRGMVPRDLRDLAHAHRRSGGTYLGVEAIPLDVWERPYEYRVDPSRRRGYTVASVGMDGVLGTADDISLSSGDLAQK